MQPAAPYQKAPIFLALCLFAVSGCSQDQDIVELECHMGAPDLNAEYVDLQVGDNAEIVLGFQGFVFTRLLLRVSGYKGNVPKSDVDLTISVEDDEPFGGTQLGVDFLQDPEGGDWISEEMYLYLSPAIVDYFKDRDVVITLNLHGAYHFCSTTMALRLVDSNPCIHIGGIDFLCPEDEE